MSSAATSLGSVTSVRHPGRPSGRSRILELDGLRGIAILLVLGHHFPGFAGSLFRIPEFGWVGVDIFFALSGYLITSILLGLRGHRHAYRTFYSRRLIRTIPPYLAATLLLLGIAVWQHWLTLHLVMEQIFFLQGRSADGVFLLSLFRHPVQSIAHAPRLMAYAHAMPLAPLGYAATFSGVAISYWSLSVEEYFYLLWAPIVLRYPRQRIAMIAVTICLLEMLLRWINGTWFAYFTLVCRFDALLFGALLAILLAHWRRHGTPRWASSLLAAALLLTVVSLTAIAYSVRPVLGRELRDSPLFIVFGYTLIPLGASALIGLLVLHADRWYTTPFRVKVLLFVGTISYTMYLLHLIAAGAVAGLLSSAHWQVTPTLEAVLASLLTVAGAYASWHWLEKPLLRWKDRRFPNTPHPAEPSLS